MFIESSSTAGVVAMVVVVVVVSKEGKKMYSKIKHIKVSMDAGSLLYKFLVVYFIGWERLQGYKGVLNLR